MSGLRINHNIAALNAYRHVQKVSEKTDKNLQHLGSGLKINTGADSPASLVISEHMRAQISGVTQAIDNSEQSIAMIQTTEGALNEVNSLLIEIRQLAIHAANEGVNDIKMLQADQEEIKNAIATIDRIASMTQFGEKKLLDGSRGANGVTSGKGLEFVSAESKTVTSPIEGWKIKIEQAATKSNITGSVEVTQEVIDKQEQLSITEGGKTLKFISEKGDSFETFRNKLQVEMDNIGLNLHVVKRDDNILQLEHNDFGSEHFFRVASDTAGVLSQVANISEESIRGFDVTGTINDEDSFGKGQILTGSVGTDVEGLGIRYTNLKEPEDDEGFAGTVSLFQNSLNFQIGGNEDQTTSISLRSMKSQSLGTGIDNISGFRSMDDINVLDFQKAQDSIKLVDKAIEETTTQRAKLGAFQKNDLEANLNNLRVSNENLTRAESVIRDTDMAKEMADFTKNQIITQSSTAMLAQANQSPQSVLALLG